MCQLSESYFLAKADHHNIYTYNVQENHNQKSFTPGWLNSWLMAEHETLHTLILFHASQKSKSTYTVTKVIKKYS